MSSANLTPWEGDTKLIAWCPRINQPATECHLDGCTHYLIERGPVAHDHREFVPGCFRCGLSRDEAEDA